MQLKFTRRIAHSSAPWSSRSFFALSITIPLDSPSRLDFIQVSSVACYWRGRLCFGRGRDRGFVLYISLFLRVLEWCVCVCLYTRVHTHKLLGYLMWAQVWDGHLESQKNPDRLKHIIHVDRIGVHITFVYRWRNVVYKNSNGRSSMISCAIKSFKRHS